MPHAPVPLAREWCGTPVPPEVRTLPHPTKLRIVRPLHPWTRWFRVGWCVLLTLMSIPFGAALPPLGVLMLAAAVYVWTRPARTTITFRPGRRWVTIAAPGTWAARSVFSVGLGVYESPEGWRANLSYSGITLAETEPQPDRDSAVDRLLPFANTIRREMGDSPLPRP